MIRRFIWRCIRFCYKVLAKPILFIIPPDKTHADMIKFASVFGRFWPFKLISRAFFYRRTDKKLQQNIFGLNFKYPVGLSAGLDKNGEIVPAMKDIGFGFSEVGSVTARPCAGNPRPWFYRLPKSQSLVINAGLGNEGSTKILKRLGKYKTLSNFPVILSVAKTNCKKVVSVGEGIDDYVATLKRANGKPYVQMFEINISCPNTYGGEPFTTPARLERLLKAIAKLNLIQPVTIKMPVDLSWDKFKELLDVILRYPIAAVTIANLFKDRSQLDLSDNLPDSVRGNLSGLPTREPSNRLIAKTYQYCGDRLKIIGVGGIFSAEQAYEKIILGASLVELVTGTIFFGPQIAAEINYDLSKFLRQDGYDNISQAIGVKSK